MRLRARNDPFMILTLLWFAIPFSDCGAVFFGDIIFLGSLCSGLDLAREVAWDKDIQLTTHGERDGSAT